MTYIERYKPKKRSAEEGHFITENTYLTELIEGVIDSRPVVLEDLKKVVSGSNRMKAMLLLTGLTTGIPAFIFLPSAKHIAGEERHRTRFTLADDTGICPIYVPKGKFDLQDIQPPWENDILLLSVYANNNGREIQSLSLYQWFETPVGDSKRNLGARILQPHLPKIST